MSRTVTNNYNLPQPMWRALAKDTYIGGGNISATRLIAPPRIVVLRKYHEDEIEEDASDRIWSLLGSSVHRMLELSEVVDTDVRAYRHLKITLSILKETGMLDGGQEESLEDLLDDLERKITPSKFIQTTKVEQRLSMPIAGIEKDGESWVWKVTAQPDVYENKTLHDYKCTSLYSVTSILKPEWNNQVNIQAALHRYNGDEVNEGFIIAIMRDWQSSKARFERDYPKSAVMKISIPIWSYEEQLAYITKRVKLHQTAEQKFLDANKDPNSLPLCTPDERWLRGEKWAIKYQNEKTGKVNIRAKLKFDNKTDALQYMSDNKPTTKNAIWAPIEHRPGINMRCMNYCDIARKFCPFGMQLHKEEEDRAMAALQAETALVNEESEDETV